LGPWWDEVKVVEPHVNLSGVHPQPIHNGLPSSNARVPGCLSILFLKVEGVVYWSTANKMPRKVPKENKLNAISNKASQTHGPCQ
jgi:hypothetical protein